MDEQHIPYLLNYHFFDKHVAAVVTRASCSLLVWSPHYTKDKELLERVQHRFTRMIKEVCDKDYLDRLNELNIWTLEERRNRADLIELFKIYKGFTTVHFESLFTLDCNNKGTCGHLAKLSKAKVPERCQKIFLFTTCN